MKITAGMGMTDEYVSYALAGADELFCGFVPRDWNERYGNVLPLNRREVLFYNIQIGTFSDMRRLAKLAREYSVPVSVTFNALYYIPEQYEIIAGYIRRLMEIGFMDYIIADFTFLIYLKNCDDIANRIKIHISGEFGEYNRISISMIKKELGEMISRFIFPRKNSLSDMKACIGALNTSGNLLTKEPASEFEAFVLNEKCHFSGAFCNSLHSDELCHMCLQPYELKRKDGKENDIINRWQNARDAENLDVIGESGCGLCALWDLRDIGVTHLKVVGRGKCKDEMVKDIAATKKALDILNTSQSRDEFVCQIKKQLFSGNCSGNCYYL